MFVLALGPKLLNPPLLLMSRGKNYYINTAYRMCYLVIIADLIGFLIFCASHCSISLNWKNSPMSLDGELSLVNKSGCHSVVSGPMLTTVVVKGIQWIVIDFSVYKKVLQFEAGMQRFYILLE